MSESPVLAWIKKLGSLAALAILIIGGWAGPSVGVTATDSEATDEEPICVRLCGAGLVDLEDPAVISEVKVFQPGVTGVIGYPTGSSYLDGCTFEFVPKGDVITMRPGPGSVNLVDTTWTKDYWVIFCQPGQLAYTFYPDGAPPPVPVIDDMIADAYRRTPVVAFSPITSPDGDEDIALVVQIPIYLWVDDVAWQTPVSATSTVPGGFTVTTTAIPDLASWSGGDQPDACTGDQMIPYDFTRGEDNQLSECFMVYKHSSAVATQTVDLSVNWDVAVACSIPVCGGPLPDLVTNSTREVVVAEILAVGR